MDFSQPGEVKPRLLRVFLKYNYESERNASWTVWVAVFPAYGLLRLTFSHTYAQNSTQTDANLPALHV